MKFTVTAIAMDRKTRKQVGQQRDEVINTKTNVLFKGFTNPIDIEKMYEAFWNDLNPHSTEIVKVINITEIQ
jgi:hypothetical protein